jgi:hypothetical protein
MCREMGGLGRGYFSVRLVVNFVAHQHERESVGIPGLRLAEKLFSPLRYGFERGPACRSDVVIARFDGKFGTYAAALRTFPWCRTPGRSSLRRGKKLSRGSGSAPGPPCPISADRNRAATVSTGVGCPDLVCACSVCSLAEAWQHLHGHPRLVYHSFFHNEVRPNRCFVRVQKLHVDVLVQQ